MKSSRHRNLQITMWYARKRYGPSSGPNPFRGRKVFAGLFVRRASDPGKGLVFRLASSPLFMLQLRLHDQEDVVDQFAPTLRIILLQLLKHGPNAVGI